MVFKNKNKQGISIFFIKSHLTRAINITDGVSPRSCRLIKLYTMLMLVSSKQAQAILLKQMRVSGVCMHSKTLDPAESWTYSFDMYGGAEIKTDAAQSFCWFLSTLRNVFLASEYQIKGQRLCSPRVGVKQQNLFLTSSGCILFFCFLTHPIKHLKIIIMHLIN